MKNEEPIDFTAAKHRMAYYLQQSHMGKNPNLLSEILRKEIPSDMFPFNKRIPSIWDFPIYTYFKRHESLLYYKTPQELLDKFPIMQKFPEDLYWCKQFMGCE